LCKSQDKEKLIGLRLTTSKRGLFDQYQTGRNNHYQRRLEFERCLPALILVKGPRADGWGIYSETEDSETSLGVYPKVLNWLSKSSFGF